MLAGLEVDVGGALVRRLAEDRVDELDDRRVVGRLAQLGDLAELVLRLVLVDGLGDGALERVEALISASMSSAAATAILQLRPVIIWMSSMASTFAGSAIATSRVLVST